MKKIIDVDRQLFIKIYSWGERSAAVGKIAVVGTKLSYYIFFVLFILGIVWVFLYKREMLFKFIFVPCAGLFINTALRKLIGRSRPMNELGIKSRIGDKKSNSCPSNHSASAMVITAAFIWVFPAFGIWLVPIGLFTGFSRILSGVHYPLDVICGFIIGAAVGIIGFIIF